MNKFSAILQKWWRGKMVCDLCLRDKGDSHHPLLCVPCGESISRLMSIELWSANRHIDKAGNVEQVRMLIREARKINSDLK